MYEHPSLSRRRERRGGAEAILHFFRAGLIGRTLKCNPACKYGGVLPQKVRASERKDTFIPDVRGHAKRSLAQTRTCACWSHEHAGAPLRMGVCLRACVCIYMCVCMHTSPPYAHASLAVFTALSRNTPAPSRCLLGKARRKFLQSQEYGEAHNDFSPNAYSITVAIFPYSNFACMTSPDAKKIWPSPCR